MTQEVTTSATELLPLWYTLPEGFHPIDLSGDVEARMEANYDGLSGLCPSATPEQLVAGVLSFEAVLGKMVEDGLVHLSSFVLKTEDDILLTGLCQISVVDRPAGDPNLYPGHVLEADPHQGPDVHTGVIPLPAGLAAVVVADQVMPVPGVFFGIPTDSTAAVRSATFHMAFPGSPQAVVISLSTEVFDADEEFLELAALVAAGTSFTPQQSSRTPQEKGTSTTMASDFG